MRIVGLLTVFMLACTSSSDETDTDSGQEPDPVLVGHDAGSTACRSGEMDPNAPYRHDLVLWTSPDGYAFTEQPVFQRCADVPSLASNGAGRVFAVFQAWVDPEIESQWDKVAYRSSLDDGATWGDVQFFELFGLPDGAGRPFDPTMVYLPETDDWRLYFSLGMNGDMLDETVCTHSALSKDGLLFTYEEEARFCADGGPVIDPAVFLNGDTFVFSAPRGAPQDGAFLATSTDGLTFTAQPNIPSDRNHRWTGNFGATDEGLRFYGAEGLYPDENRMWYANSNDNGTSWSDYIRTNIPAGKDPAVLRMPDGGWWLLIPTLADTTDE